MKNGREATNEEILKHLDYDIRHNRRAMFRHFITEQYRGNARNQVAHKRYGRSRVRVIDGQPRYFL